jgi:serine protease AprX
MPSRTGILAAVTTAAALSLMLLASPGAAAAEPADRSFVLDLGGLRFDPLVQPPELASAGLHAAEPGPNFRLVQLQGPIRSEWLLGLAGLGIEVVQYVHPFTYIVWADREQLEAAAGLPGVRWAGEYAQEYRVLPHQRGRDATVVPTAILVSRHVEEEWLRLDLELAGAVVHSITPMTSHLSVVYLDIPGNRYLDLGAIPAVYTVQYIPPETAPRGEMSNQSIVGNHGPPPGHVLFPGYAQWLTDTGYDGTGVIVGIVDGGIRTTHTDLADRISPCVPSGDSPTSCTTANNTHGTHVAGAVAGTGATGTTDSAGFLRGQGVAPGAQVVQQRYGPFIGGGPGNMQPDGMLKIYRESALSGALLTNNSWGPTGTPQGYDIPTMQVDMITRDADPNLPGHQAVLPVWSIMNGNGDSGGACAPSSLGSPDEAKNLFAVGSTRMQSGVGVQFPNIYDVSPNSGHGPACDGRLNPHIVAPGCSTDSPTATSNTSHGLSCGTSMASPVVSGAVSIFVERYRDLYAADPSPALIKAAFTAVATNLQGRLNADGGVMGHPPDRFQGWGRIDLEAVANPPDNVMFFDQEVIFTDTGQSWSFPLIADDPSKPVRLMLMWTDAKGHGLGGTTPAWVNDLDLQVEAVSGLYLGNQIGPDGYSQTGGTADEKNNMEGVFLRANQHQGTTFEVTVLAANLAADALDPFDLEAPMLRQDFALVCYNCDFGDPTFTLELEPASVEMCVPASGSEDFLVDVTVGVVGEYTGTVALSTSGEPAGVTSDLDPDAVVVPGSSAWTVTVASTTAAGTYTITLAGDDGEDVHTAELALKIDEPLADGPALLSPPDEAIDVVTQPELSWSALPEVEQYRLEVDTTPGFGSPVIDVVVDATSFTPPTPLDTSTLYYWRVSGINLCGDGVASETFSFTTWGGPPVASISPGSFEVEVPKGMTESEILDVGNIGGSPLAWAITTDVPIGLRQGLAQSRSLGQRDFEDYFDIANWTFENNPPGTGGSFSTNPGPPVELFLQGGNSGIMGDTDLWIEIPEDGEITIDWGYQSTDTGDWDQGGYIINGVFTQLADNASQVPYFNGSATVTVSQGDIFGFRVHTRDGLFGPGTLGVTNFVFVPDFVLCDQVTEVPWLSVTPESGVTPAGGSFPVDVVFDAEGLDEGSYQAALCVETNDPARALIIVPLELTVLPDPCPVGPSHLVLDDMTVTGPELFQACQTITAGPGFTVTSTGSATLRAGQRIVLRNGVEVETGGTLSAEIDPDLLP